MDSVANMTAITGLLVAHGVYALLVIFLFYQQRITRKNYKSAEKPEEKAYFRTLHTCTTVAVYVLTALVAGVWIYATFVSPEMYLKGTVKGLEERAETPAAPDDPPSIRQQLTPYETDVEFFTRVMRTDLGTGHYDLGWLLVADRGTETLGLVFQQQVDHPLWSSPRRPRVVEGTFLLDLNKIESLGRKHIHLQYEPDSEDPYGKLGHLLMRVDGQTFDLRQWRQAADEMAYADDTAVSFFSLSRPAFAQSATKESLPTPRIAAGLASPDLKTQVEARRLLERESTATVQEILSSAGDLEEQPLLLHNLSAAVNQQYKKRGTSDPKIEQALAQALYETGDFAAALPHFERFLDTELDTKGNVIRRGNTLFRTERYEEAAAEYQRYLTMSPSRENQSVALANLGAAQVYAGQWTAAEESYQAALSLNPSNLVALSNLAFFHYRRGDLDQASALYRRVLDQEPHWGPALRGLATIEKRRGDLDEAVELLETVVRQTPGDASALNNLAFYYAELGENLDQALEYIERAIALGGESAELLDTKGWVLYKQGKYDEALPLVQRAVESAPKNDVRRAHLQAIQHALEATPPTGGEASGADQQAGSR